jgi:hypothetical protein
VVVWKHRITFTRMKHAGVPAGSKSRGKPAAGKGNKPDQPRPVPKHSISRITSSWMQVSFLLNFSEPHVEKLEPAVVVAVIRLRRDPASQHVGTE